jgi:hypothetical protein
MKLTLTFIFIAMLFSSCKPGRDENNNELVGTWKLITATIIEKGDTTITDYTAKISFIKIINNTHFAFLQHDLTRGKDSSAVYASGGGKYFLMDNLYKEQLEYCNDRTWEGNDFEFAINIKNDTLIQKGIEKIEKAGINRVNIEKYVRLKNSL